MLFGLLDAIHLPFCPDLCLKLRNGPEHVKEQAPGCIAGIDVLVQYLEVNLGPKGYWNSMSGAMGVGMSNSDLRGVLLDSDSGQELWRGELYYRDVPRVASDKWERFVSGMYTTLTIEED